MDTEQGVNSDAYCRANRILTNKQAMWVIALAMVVMAGLLIFLATENWSLRNRLDACQASCGAPPAVQAEHAVLDGENIEARWFARSMSVFHDH